jgi:hypothetical protein
LLEYLGFETFLLEIPVQRRRRSTKNSKRGFYGVFENKTWGRAAVPARPVMPSLRDVKTCLCLLA